MGYILYLEVMNMKFIMKKTRKDTKDSEHFLGLLKDQFVVFYALTNVAIEAYKTARKNYFAKVCLNSNNDKEAG